MRSQTGDTDLCSLLSPVFCADMETTTPANRTLEAIVLVLVGEKEEQEAISAPSAEGRILRPPAPLRCINGLFRIKDSFYVFLCLKFCE